MNLIISSVIFSCALVSASFADDCFVIGFHEPHTHIYNGPTFCNQVKLKGLTVYGPLQVKNSVISGEINVSGPIAAEQSKLGNLTVQKQLTAQKIKLSDHTVVDGDITFIGKPGSVFLNSHSTVNGKVINGAVISDR